MDKIKFGSHKSKVKTFSSGLSEQEPDKSPVPAAEHGKVQDRIKPINKIYKNTSDIFDELKHKLIKKHNIDDISVYVITLSYEYRLNIKNIYGCKIGKQELEKYYGFDSPVILTNADGFSDISSHRARFIERYDDYYMIISSSAFEAFKSELELEDIRNKVKAAYKEVLNL